jgi:Tfp pilus assembly protein PilX
MNFYRKAGEKSSEAGAALLIAIFALLLISVIAIAMLVSSGTDSALAGNYRTSTEAYYAAVAGVEEARGRLLWKNPDYVNLASPAYFPDQVNPTMALNKVLYIINPTGGETVAPWDTTNPLTYPDSEFQTEFTIDASAANWSVINSVSSLPGLPGTGPLFKWVRVTAATVHSLGTDVAGDGNTTDGTNLLYYDPTHVGAGGVVKPGLVKTPTNALGQPLEQVLEITALGVVAPNTKKLLQYVVVASALSMGFPGGLTLAGNGVSYSGPDSTSFYMDGIDPVTGRTCVSAALPPVYAIGYTNAGDSATVISGIDPAYRDYYWGTGYVPSSPPAPATPSVGLVTLPPNFQKPSSVESLLLTLRRDADLYLSPTAPATSVPGSALPSSLMSSTNPMTVFVDGDLDLTAWHNTGYGLLVVTGNLNYDPDAFWEGVVLVIGKGTFTASHAGIGKIEGAMLVAKSRDSAGLPLPDPNLGPSSVTFAPTTGGTGIYYNSCWINAALRPTTMKVLSFREIASPN